MSRDFAAEDPKGGDDPLSSVLRARHGGGRDAVQPQVASPRAGDPRPRPSRRPNGTTRSWYLPFDVADELSATANELFHDLRGKIDKAAILGALIRVGLDNKDRARRELQKIVDQP